MKSIPGWTTNIEEISNGVFSLDYSQKKKKDPPMGGQNEIYFGIFEILAKIIMMFIFFASKKKF